jgi:aspartyl-tRNA(Asn)/glutamyl-tRNA(Gln) amidotransferase subunit A
MTIETDLLYLPAVHLAELIRSRKLSPIELVEAYLHRIEQLNGTYKSFITICSDEAIESAKRAEKALSRKSKVGPLHGLPIGVKDQISTNSRHTRDSSPLSR